MLPARYLAAATAELRPHANDGETGLQSVPRALE